MKTSAKVFWIIVLVVVLLALGGVIFTEYDCLNLSLEDTTNSVLSVEENIGKTTERIDLTGDAARSEISANYSIESGSVEVEIYKYNVGYAGAESDTELVKTLTFSANADYTTSGSEFLFVAAKPYAHEGTYAIVTVSDDFEGYAAISGASFVRQLSDIEFAPLTEAVTEQVLKFYSQINK